MGKDEVSEAGGDEWRDGKGSIRYDRRRKRSTRCPAGVAGIVRLTSRGRVTGENRVTSSLIRMRRPDMNYPSQLLELSPLRKQNMTMTFLLAMGGAAEASMSISLFIGWVSMVFVFSICVVAATTNKRWVVWSALTIFVLYAVLFVPWEGYWFELSPDAQEDLDAVMWHQRGMFQLHVASVTVIIMAMMLTFAIFSRKREGAETGLPLESQHEPAG